MPSGDAASRPLGSAPTDVFRRVLSAMPVGLLMLDDHDTIHYANGAAASILGGRTDELIGTTFDARETTRTVHEAWDIETGRRWVARQSEATLPGSPRTRIVMLTDETDETALREIQEKARGAAVAMATLERAVDDAVGELSGIPGSEGAATRLREAFAATAAAVQGIFSMQTEKQAWHQERGRETASQGERGEADPGRVAPAQRRMLVVDDDGAVARITARALAALGIEAIAQNSVSGALSVLEKQSVDTVLVDAMMPGPGIEQVCIEVRRLQPAVQLVVMSGADTVADRVRDLSDGFLAKPFSIAELRGLFEEKLPLPLRRVA